MRKIWTFFILFILATIPAIEAAEATDLITISKIRHEGINHSQVMKIAGYLSDVIGPRTPGSPALKKAMNWTVNTFKEWGLDSAGLESYGDFGIGWAPQYISAHLLEPYYAPLLAISVEWGSSTAGKITGQPIYVDIQSKDDFPAYKGRLRNKIVLYVPPRPSPTEFTPPATRHTQESLERLTESPIPDEQTFGGDYQRGFLDDLEDFFRAEGIGVLVSPSSSRMRDYGIVHATGIRSARNPGRIHPLPEIILAVEHYNRIQRILVEYKEPVEMEVEVRTEYYDQDLKGYNVVAEITGTDKKDEIVMLGGHIDSWSPGTGAADNAAGVAVCMEAVRILKTLGLKSRRTIRVVFWDAEEKGWVGSKNYVANHFGEVESMTVKPEQAKVSAYYNFDNGGGRIRGIYLLQNIQVKPIFEEWLKPFHDLGATHVVTRYTRGSDHVALNNIGIPSFQFIQDPLDYGTLIHHTNMDVYDHLIAEDLIQASVIMASFVYHTAMRAEMLPRKPLLDPFKYPVRR